jgi:DNA-binding beta-propeller fold protein YncE
MPDTYGQGDFQYTFVDNWMKMPDGMRLLECPGVAVDGEDRVFILTRGEHPIMVFDKDGNFVRTFGEGHFSDNRTHGLYIGHDDSVLAADDGIHTIQKFSANGEKVWELGERNNPAPRWSGEPFNRPTSAATRPSNGDIYVSDGYGNSRVHRFSGDGELKFSWGTPGKTEPGEFHVPHGVWVHTDGRVFVADRENNRMQIFTPDGEFLTQWTGLSRPCDIYIDQDQAVFVPELDAFMSILSIDGDLLARWEGPGGVGAHAIWLDSRGDIYLNQNLEGQRLLKYRKVG